MLLFLLVKMASGFVSVLSRSHLMRDKVCLVGLAWAAARELRPTRMVESTAWP